MIIDAVVAGILILIWHEMENKGKSVIEFQP